MDDIVFPITQQVKARTDQIVINNTPGAPNLRFFQSIRLYQADGSMGKPIQSFVSYRAIDADLLEKTYMVNGAPITGAQVQQWLTALANDVTTTDAPAQLAALSTPSL